MRKKVYIVIDRLLSINPDFENNIYPLFTGFKDSKGRKDIDVIVIDELQMLQNLYTKKKITPDDLFIFTSGWGPMAIYYNFWKEYYCMQSKTVAFWTSGAHFDYDRKLRKYLSRDWCKSSQRGMFRVYGRSYFISEYFLTQFKNIISGKIFADRLHARPFPLDYVQIEVVNASSLADKQDYACMPLPRDYSTFIEPRLRMLVDACDDIQMLYPQEVDNVKPVEIYKSIHMSKVCWIPYTEPNLFEYIYACYLSDTIPLVPNIQGLDGVVPEEFRYPLEWEQSQRSFIPNVDQLADKLQTLMQDYDTHLPTIKKLAHDTYHKYFSSTEVFTELLDIVDNKIKLPSLVLGKIKK